MELLKIGQFIAECRKEKGVTQKQLAELLFISEKTVSKWECGKGLPDPSLMLPLCEKLGITVNELLLGERVDEDAYKKNAEENMLRLIVRTEKENKRRFYISVVCGMLTIISVLSLIAIASFVEMDGIFRGIFIGFAVLVAIKGIAATAILELDAGQYQCPRCNHFFKPTILQYVKGPHILTKRKLVCPACGKKNYCKYIIVKSEKSTTKTVDNEKDK